MDHEVTQPAKEGNKRSLLLQYLQSTDDTYLRKRKRQWKMTRENQPTREIILPPTAKMGVDKLTEKQKFQAVSLWQEEQLKALSRPVTKRQLELPSWTPRAGSVGKKRMLLTGHIATQ